MYSKIIVFLDQHGRKILWLPFMAAFFSEAGLGSMLGYLVIIIVVESIHNRLEQKTEADFEKFKTINEKCYELEKKQIRLQDRQRD